MHETRFSLWSTWLRSWADSHFSLMFGHGLGYLPEGLSGFVRTPHNLFIQLIADGGFLGISIVVSLMVILLPLLRFGGARNFVFLGLTWSLYASLSSVLYYPSSVWASLWGSCSFLFLVNYSRRRILSRPEKNGSRSIFVACCDHCSAPGAC